MNAAADLIVYSSDGVPQLAVEAKRTWMSYRSATPGLEVDLVAVLGDGDLAKQVGAACGFENNCSFSRAFRARYGMPPSLYRMRDWTGAPDCANAYDIGGKAAFASGP